MQRLEAEAAAAAAKAAEPEPAEAAAEEAAASAPTAGQEEASLQPTFGRAGKVNLARGCRFSLAWPWTMFGSMLACLCQQPPVM